MRQRFAHDGACRVRGAESATRAHKRNRPLVGPLCASGWRSVQIRNNSCMLSGPGVPSGIVARAAADSAPFFPLGFFEPFVAFTFVIFHLVAFGFSVVVAATVVRVAPVAANWPGSVFWKRLAVPLVFSSRSIAA
jgi:hypothetical protein